MSASCLYITFSQLNALHRRRPSSEDTLDSRQDWGQPGSGDWQTGGGIDTSGFTYFAGSNNYGPYGYDHGRRGDLNVVRYVCFVASNTSVC